MEALRTQGKKQAAEAAFRLAGHYAEQQTWRRVEQLISEAVQLHPSHIGYLQAATQIAFERKNYTLARELLLRAVEQAQRQQGNDSQQLLNLKDNLAASTQLLGEAASTEKGRGYTDPEKFERDGCNGEEGRLPTKTLCRGVMLNRRKSIKELS
ncbi:MAG: hypothetical protein HOL04_11385 [Gammaproteobacteria bacterium]|nr:hypothetical protein [Gammaproteobacteria bacterium]MBT4605454.1 hypothetical protein [Thiotrichales bacterium]MBT3473399.1 hypothetical protein [Gammaproteobacteria bacterium]MBT3967456.1 hypothetical protein [Gammaproteobacteria bacterium]MBT4080858.1 hypothetical protein [Gammaproteobacteria bacterium]